MDQNSVAVKIGYNGDLHRLRVDLNTFTLDALTRLFVHTFRLTPGLFVVRYTDPEGDALNVCSDAEFVEACRVFLSGKEHGQRALKFTAVDRTGGDGASAQAPTASTTNDAADPLIRAVEQLVATLNVTVDKVQAEGWTGADGATEALYQAAQDARDTLEAAREAAKDKPYEEVVQETSEGIKTAAVGISSFAQRLVKTFIPEKKTAAAAPTPATTPADEEKEAVPAASAQPEEAVSVADVDVVAAPVVPEPEVVVAPTEPVAFSPDEIKWAEQLGMVRGIFPDADTARVISMLERSKGDVNVVINVLMEEM